MISQMHWIMTHFDHRYTKKAIAASKQYFVGFSVFWEKGRLLGQNGYKVCLNTPNPFLTLLINEMHWILTHFDHRNTNKAIKRL
ncbi:hypothetical protein AtEden1_Chr1g0041391 [Arabidopsis thaliana]